MTRGKERFEAVQVVGLTTDALVVSAPGDIARQASALFETASQRNVST